MALQLNIMSCCGIRELANIGSVTDPKVTVETVIRGSSGEVNGSLRYSPGCGVYIFSGITQNREGDAGRSYHHDLATFITTNKLGVVHRLPDFINPNTKNLLTPYAWYIDRDACQRYFDEHFKDKPATYVEPPRSDRGFVGDPGVLQLQVPGQAPPASSPIRGW